MKKNLIIAFLAVIAGLFISELKAQSPWAPAWGKRKKQQQTFYYYPQANMYYNVASRQYLYPRNGVWVSVATPHFSFSFSNMPHETLYYDGPEIWMENRVHIKRYRGMSHDDAYYYYKDQDERRRYKHRHDDDDDDDDDNR